MKFAVVLALLVGVAAAQDKYTTKYDGVDVGSILKNDRLLTSYFNCVMDKGKCSPDGAELKKHIPEALEEDCAKCSDKQKEGAQEVLKFVYENKPDLFKELEAKYDTQGKYRAKYKERVEEALGKKI